MRTEMLLLHIRLQTLQKAMLQLAPHQLQSVLQSEKCWQPAQQGQQVHKDILSMQ
jgi:hypothetical protein